MKIKYQLSVVVILILIILPSSKCFKSSKFRSLQQLIWSKIHIFDAFYQNPVENLLVNFVTFNRKRAYMQETLMEDADFKYADNFIALTVQDFYNESFTKSKQFHLVSRFSYSTELYVIVDPISLFEINSTLFRFDTSFSEDSIFVIVLKNNFELPAQFNAFRQSSVYPGFVINPIFFHYSAYEELHDISLPPILVTSMTSYSYLFHSPYVSGCRMEVLQNMKSDCHRTSAILDILSHHLNITLKTQYVSPFNKNNFDDFNGPLRLESCIGCGYKFQNRFSRRTSLLIQLFYTDNMYLYYCKDKSIFVRVEWHVFPFVS